VAVTSNSATNNFGSTQRLILIIVTALLAAVFWGNLFRFSPRMIDGTYDTTSDAILRSVLRIYLALKTESKKMADAAKTRIATITPAIPRAISMPHSDHRKPQASKRAAQRELLGCTACWRAACLVRIFAPPEKMS
jgi:hypothetical protein